MLPSRVVSVSRLREAAQARVAASSRRAVAREIGVYVRGLEVFLAGATPHPKTLEKLLRWYREQVEETEGPPVSGAEALRVLLRALPPGDRAGAAAEAAALLRSLYERAGVPLPPDLEGLGDSSVPSAPPPGAPAE